MEGQLCREFDYVSVFLKLACPSLKHCFLVEHAIPGVRLPAHEVHLGQAGIACALLGRWLCFFELNCLWFKLRFTA